MSVTSSEEWPASPKGRFSISVLASTLLHAALLALALFLLPRALPDVPLMRLVLPVELVASLDEGGSPGDGIRSQTPAESAPPQPAARLQAPPPPRARAAVTSPVSPKPPQPLATPDPLEARLKALSQLRLPDAERAAAPKPRDGTGDAERDAGSRGAERGRGQGYSVRDVLRAQVERHWHIDRSELGAAELEIEILLTIDRDGGVRSVEVLPAPGHTGDALYRSLARSARMAVLNSAPFHLPGQLAEADADGLRNVRLTLNPRKSVQ